MCCRLKLQVKGEQAVSEENKALARRFLEAQAKGDMETLDELMAPYFVDRSLLPGQKPSREDYKRSLADMLDRFSNTGFSVEAQFAEGDYVVSRFTGTSVHRGEFLGAAPTGRETNYSGITIHRVADGKIVEEWSESDNLEVLQPALEQEMRSRERAEQELLVARRIQQALLPRAVPVLEGWEIAPHYQPAREVGGDFYDFLLLPHGRVSLVIGDVSGKGVPAAVLMASTQSVLRAVAQRGGAGPGQVLAEANEILCTYIPPNMFVTCFYAILDPESGHLVYANAGHSLPCCRHEHAEATDLSARGMPLGLMAGMGYEEKETILEAGDCALFYSDGLVEAHNPQGEMFGTPRLRGLLSELPEGGRG
jgi:predicted ester cyclase